MTTVSGSFAATGNSAPIAVPFEHALNISITGVFEGVVEVQESIGAAAWRVVFRLTGAGDASITRPGLYRVTAREYVSGIILYSMETVQVRAVTGEFSGDAIDVRYDNVASGAVETNVQDAIDTLFEDEGIGAPSIIRKTYLIRGGLNGVIAGSLDDVTANANRAAIQAIINAADSDNAIIEADGEEYQIQGGPLIFPSTGFGMIYRGALQTTFRQRSDGVAVIQFSDIGGSGGQVIGLDFDGCTLHYLNDQSGQGTSTTVGATMCVFGNMWKCKVKNIRAANTITTARPYRNFYMPQGSSVFSCNFSDLYGFQPYYSNFHIANFGTGNAYTNIYLSGVGISGTAQSVTQPFLWQIASGAQMHDSVFNQLNVEWCISNQLMRINNVRGAVFNSLHIEQNRLSGADAAHIYNVISNIQINGLVFLDNRINSSDASGNPSLFKHFQQGRTNVDTMFMITNNSTYINIPFYVQYQADADGVINNPGRTNIRAARFVDGVGTTIRDNLRLDRKIGAGNWGTLYLDSADEIRTGGAQSCVIGGDHRIDVSKTVYGADWIDGTLIIPGSLAADANYTFSNRMGPAGSAWANVPIPPSQVRRVVRGGTTTNVANILNHNGSNIGSIAGGVATSELFFYFNGTDWAAA